MDCIIGIDIGTTNLKSVTIDTAGNILYTAEISNETFSPAPGYSEQDPESIFEKTVALLQKAVAQLNDKEHLRFIVFSSAMHGMMAIDQTGQPLTKVLTWADNRAASIAEALQSGSLGLSLYRQTGTPIHPMSPLCKIAWIRQHQPENFHLAFKFVSPKELIFYRFFGQYVVDYSIASATGLFDIENKCWHPEALAFAGIQEERLSEPVPVDTVFTQCNAAIAAKINLPPGVSFVIGGSDGCLANIGSGAVRRQSLALTIGTSGAVRKMTAYQALYTQSLFEYILDSENYIIGGAINNGGIALKWFARNFYDAEEAMEMIFKDAAAVSAGADGLVFLPYINGERTPVWDAGASGTFAGIRSVHTKAHFARAVLEGICFSLKQVLELLSADGQEVFISGGFTHSLLWKQILADVLQRTLKAATSGADASALGAAFIGLRAGGYINRWEDTLPWLGEYVLTTPDPAVAVVYEKNYDIYKSLYPSLPLS